MNVLTGVILVLFGIEDLRTKKISLWFLILVILAAGIYGVSQNGVEHSALGIIPGVFLLFLAFWKPDSIGKGDGLLAIAYGSLHGWRDATIWLMYSFVLVSVVGLFVKVSFRKHKLQLPFIPFTGIVHMGMCL